MKKLNRKGFTLIELLAVIVIMAIIVVVTVPTIINSIADARVSSIWNLAVSTANSYDTMAAQDLIATSKTLAGKEATATWKCITTAQATLFDLSTTDVVIKENGTLGDAVSENEIVNNKITQNTCSAIRLKSNGSAEVLLVAADGGKFAVSAKVVYALSSADTGNDDNTRATQN